MNNLLPNPEKLPRFEYRVIECEETTFETKDTNLDTVFNQLFEEITKNESQ